MWAEAQQHAFNALCTALLSEPVLVYPRFDLPFIVTSDALKLAIGGLLLQVVDGNEHSVAYYSQTLNVAQSHYAAAERELLAVVTLVKVWDHTSMA